MAKSTKPAAKKPTAKAAPVKSASRKIAKTQIVTLVTDKTSLTKKQAGEAVTAVLHSVVNALQSGQSVGLPGLGTLSVTQTAERTGVRPGTSQRITIPAGKKIRFKIASTLKGIL